MQALKISSDKPAINWCFWSTTESIQKDVPSVTAIIETLIAVPLYWWIALQVGMLPSLLIGLAVAPLVLLRSEESVALGLKWLLAFEHMPTNKTYHELSLNQRRFLWVLGLASVVLSSYLAFNLTDDYLNLIGPSLWVGGIRILIGVILIASLAAFLFSLMLVVVSLFSFLVRPDIVLADIRAPSELRYALAILITPGSMLGMRIGVLIVTTMICVAATLSTFGQAFAHCQEILDGLPFTLRQPRCLKLSPVLKARVRFSIQQNQRCVQKSPV